MADWFESNQPTGGDWFTTNTPPSLPQRPGYLEELGRQSGITTLPSQFMAHPLDTLGGLVGGAFSLLNPGFEPGPMFGEMTGPNPAVEAMRQNLTRSPESRAAALTLGGLAALPAAGRMVPPEAFSTAGTATGAFMKGAGTTAIQPGTWKGFFPMSLAGEMLHLPHGFGLAATGIPRILRGGWEAAREALTPEEAAEGLPSRFPPFIQPPTGPTSMPPPPGPAGPPEEPGVAPERFEPGATSKRNLPKYTPMSEGEQFGPPGRIIPRKGPPPPPEPPESPIIIEGIGKVKKVKGEEPMVPAGTYTDASSQWHKTTMDMNLEGYPSGTKTGSWLSNRARELGRTGQSDMDPGEIRNFTNFVQANKRLPSLEESRGLLKRK